MAQETSVVNGDVIRGLRERTGWSQGELADRAGISQSVLSRLERNVPSPRSSVTAVASVATALSVPVSYLLHDEHYHPEETIPKLEKALEGVVRKLADYGSTEQRRAAFILEGYLTSLLFENDESGFMDLGEM